MKIHVRFVAGLVSLAVILACGGNSEDLFGNPLPTVFRIYPCQGVVGDEITIEGTGMNGPNEKVFVGTTQATVVSHTATRIVIKAPGGTDGRINVSNTYGNSYSPHVFEHGPNSVAEIENNDNIDGSNATLVPCAQATGNLDNVTDRDHFIFECIMSPTRVTAPFYYRLIVDPPVVRTVYIDGNAVTLNASGNAEYLRSKPTSGNRLLVGLTGGTGAYTLTIQMM